MQTYIIGQGQSVPQIVTFHKKGNKLAPELIIVSNKQFEALRDKLIWHMGIVWAFEGIPIQGFKNVQDNEIIII